MNTHGLQGRTREGRRVLGAHPLPRHGDRDNEDAADDAHRIAKRIADRRVGISREAGGCVEGGSSRQSAREETRREPGGQAEEAASCKRDDRAHDAHDRCEGEKIRLLTQILKESGTRGYADAVHEEGQTHRLDDRHVGADNLGMQRRNDEADEESTRRAKAQRTDPNGPDRRTQRNNDKQREQG